MPERTSPKGLARPERTRPIGHQDSPGASKTTPHPRQPNHQPDDLSTTEVMAPAPPLGDDAVSQAYPTSKGMSSTPPARAGPQLPETLSALTKSRPPRTTGHTQAPPHHLASPPRGIDQIDTPGAQHNRGVTQIDTPGGTRTSPHPTTDDVSQADTHHNAPQPISAPFTPTP